MTLFAVAFVFFWFGYVTCAVLSMILARLMGRWEMARQTRIPGTEADEIPEIVEAAEKYVTLRDRRMGAWRKEMEAQELLHDLMKQHRKKHYALDDGSIVEIVVGNERVKVKSAKDEEAEE